MNQASRWAGFAWTSGHRESCQHRSLHSHVLSCVLKITTSVRVRAVHAVDVVVVLFAWRRRLPRQYWCLGLHTPSPESCCLVNAKGL